MSEYNYNDKYFEKIDTEEKSYWLGFLYADGYIEPIYRKNKIKAFRIELGLGEKDKGHLISFVEHIGSNVPVKDRIQNYKGKKYNTCRVRVNNTKMCRDLMALGCSPNKSLNLEFPKNNILPESLIRHFVRGYFDGDGCIHYSERNYIDKRNNKEYTNRQFNISFVGTESFLSSLMSILKNQNIGFEFNKNSNCGKAKEVKLARKNEIFLFYKYIYADSNVYLKRKKDKFELGFEKLNIKIPASFL